MKSRVNPKESECQVLIRGLHSELLKLKATWPVLNAQTTLHAQSVVNAHLQLQFVGSPQMGNLGSFDALQQKLEAKFVSSLQRRLSELQLKFAEMVELVGSCFETVMHLCSSNNPHIVSPSQVFKSSPFPKFVEWAIQIICIYCKELHIKQSILTSFGADDILTSSAYASSAELPSKFLSDSSPSFNPFRQFSPFESSSSAAAQSAIVSASSSTDAQNGRLGYATEDTLTLYLTAWSLEPYLDTAQIDIAFDLFAFELGSSSS